MNSVANSKYIEQVPAYRTNLLRFMQTYKHERICHMGSVFVAFT